MWRPFLSIATILSLGACAAVPDLGPRSAPRPPQSLASSEALAGPSADWPREDWWTEFGDPELAALIEEGLAGAPDIAAAAARVRAADAIAKQAGATLQPNLTAEASAGGVKQSKTLGIPPQFVPDGVQDTGRISANLVFDLDLWGRNRAALRAARGEAGAARVDAAQTWLMLSTGIASAYVDLAQYFAERDVAADALRVREDTARLTSERVEVGVDTRGSLRLAEARVPAARADIDALDEAIALTRNRIAALLGRGPDRGRTIDRPHLSDRPYGIPEKAGIALVGRRPDIVAARLRAEAAAERIKVAHADFYPNISLSAVIGLQSLGLDALLKAGSSYGNGGAAISLPIFNGGRITGRYAQARAEYDGAVARYDVTLIGALRDTADALASRKAAELRLAEQRRSLDAATEAANIARLRYRGGLSSQLTVLVAEDTELASRRAVADLEARRLSLDIALIRALGGGYRSPQSLAGAN